MLNEYGESLQMFPLSSGFFGYGFVAVCLAHELLFTLFYNQQMWQPD